MKGNTMKMNISRIEFFKRCIKYLSISSLLAIFFNKKINDVNAQVTSPVITNHHSFLFTPPRSGDITFFVNGNSERLRICSDGGFLVKGKLVKNDIEIYNEFKLWLKSANYVNSKS